MKTLKTVTLGICLFIACTSAKANKISDEDKTASQFYAINTYVDAMSRGKIAGLEQVLDKTAKFSFLKGKNIVSYERADAIEIFHENQNIEQNCTVNTSIVSNNADVEVVKIDMNYDGFVRTNYVTLTNNGTAWRITNVYTVIK